MQTAGFCLFATAIGECAIAWDDELLLAVHLPDTTPHKLRAKFAARYSPERESQPPAFVQEAIRRIQRLLEGEQDDLADLPLALHTVPEFHRRVYEVTRAIPPGRTLTYGEVARRIGEPGASRAVGQALGLNPFAPVVPCHRVLAAGGASGGFSAEGGAATKLKMLEIEKAQFGPAPGLFDG
jgi:methylated-DNA-[protein]-cysteine S-methyltransferase